MAVLPQGRRAAADPWRFRPDRGEGEGGAGNKMTPCSSNAAPERPFTEL
jgi:hypothetical protein